MWECPECGSSDISRNMGMLIGGFGWDIQHRYRCDACGHTWLYPPSRPRFSMLNDEKLEIHTPLPEWMKMRDVKEMWIKAHREDIRKAEAQIAELETHWVKGGQRVIH